MIHLSFDLAQLELVRVILRYCPELVLLRDVLGRTALMCSVINDAVSLTKALLVCRDGKEVCSALTVYCQVNVIFELTLSLLFHDTLKKNL